jgi:uncharacterized protein YozE (UPF0346 family)
MMEEKHMTFWAYLKTQAHRNDPIGDLARDAKADKRFPRGLRTLATLTRYLENLGAYSAIPAASQAWAEYQATEVAR